MKQFGRPTFFQSLRASSTGVLYSYGVLLSPAVGANDPEAALIIAQKHAKGKIQPEYVTCGSCSKPHPVLR